MRSTNDMVLQLANKLMEIEIALTQSSQDAKLLAERESNLYALAYESGINTKDLCRKPMAEQHRAYLDRAAEIYQDLKKNQLVGSLVPLKVK